MIRPTPAPVCPYREKSAVLSARVAGSIVTHLWMCASRNAHVGCRRGTTAPLGTLANAELRAARSRARDTFVPVWRRGHKSRTGAFLWLAHKLGVDPALCHFDLFTAEQCEVVAAASIAYLAKKEAACKAG